MTSPTPTNPENELYAHLSNEVRQELARYEQPTTVSAGASLVCAGALVSHLVFLNSGSVEISIPTTRSDLSLGLAGPGKVFGLQSIVSGELSPITATCKEQCRLTLVPKDAFLEVLRKNPPVYFAIARVLSDDLAAANHAIKKHRYTPKSKARINSGTFLQIV